MATVLLINTVMFIVALRIAKNSIQKRGEGAEKTLALMKGLFTILFLLLNFIYDGSSSQDSFHLDYIRHLKVFI